MTGMGIGERQLVEELSQVWMLQTSDGSEQAATAATRLLLPKSIN